MKSAIGLTEEREQQLVHALRAPERVHPRGVAVTRLFLTDPCSALYLPAYPDELHEIARITGSASVGVRMHWLYADEHSPASAENSDGISPDYCCRVVVVWWRRILALLTLQ